MDWFSEHAWEAWLGLAMLFAVAELFSLDLVLLMFAVGCIAGVVTAAVGAPVVLQVLATAAASVAMLALVRPSMVKRLHNGPDLKQGAAALIGREGYVVAEVTDQGGQVKIGGEIWTARPYDDDAVIAPGAKVQIFEIRGATAYVHEVPRLGS